MINYDDLYSNTTNKVVEVEKKPKIGVFKAFAYGFAINLGLGLGKIIAMGLNTYIYEKRLAKYQIEEDSE